MELSNEMMMKAKWVADMMHTDGLTAEMMNDPEFLAMSTEAYLAGIGKKIQKIQSQYLSNPLAREAMQRQVLSTI